MRFFIGISWALLGLATCVPAAGQELAVGLGGVRAGEDNSHAYSLAYQHRLFGPLLGSVTYLNEGHLPDHHRDGFGAQLWLEAGPKNSRFSLALGAGPYRYFDTARAPAASGGFEDRSGWGALYSAAINWRPSGRWFYQLRYNRVLVKNGFDTNSLLLGAGLRLDPDGNASSGSSQVNSQPRNEVMLFGGRTVMNSFGNERASAKAIEYRREFGELLHGSLTLLDEGDTQLARRRGLLAQGWLEPGFQDERITLGIGAGPYLAYDSRAEDRTHLAAALSLTASWRVADSWLLRGTFHRVMSFYHRDADVFLLGLGYRF